MIYMFAVGHLVSHVSLRKAPDNQTIAILRMSSGRHYKDKSGTRHADYITLKVHGRLAELCAKYCYPGCLMAAVGDFETIPREGQPECEMGFLVKARAIDFLFPLVAQVQKQLDDFKPETPEDTGVFHPFPAQTVTDAAGEETSAVQEEVCS